MQRGFYFNQQRCTGCYTCVVACKDWHDISLGPSNWIRIVSIEKGQFPNINLSYLFNTCLHCSYPLCARACPASAIKKREEDGIVIVDAHRCSGRENCKSACLKACPYKAPQFSSEGNAKMQKCDLCLDRLFEGKMTVCVEACPMRALDAGPLNMLEAKYGNKREAEGFSYHKKAQPSIIFKSKIQH
jgi:anaerobic dimethyl sulfoxide reductase subunit B (iron-sulfur subunit)